MQVRNIEEILGNLPPDKVEAFYRGGLRALEREVRTPEAGGPPPLPNSINLQALAQGPPPNIDWIIKDLFPRGTIGLIVGQTGSGKTFFALNLAIWLASAFLEAPFETERPQKIIFLNNEDSELLLQRRLWHLSKHYSAIWNKVSENLLVFPVFGLLGPLAKYGPHKNPQPSSNFEVLKRLLEKYRPDLVFLDTFSRFFGLSENAAEDVSFWLFLLENLAKDFGCSFLILHHPNKGGLSGSIESSRGSSVLTSNTRLLVHIDRVSDSFRNSIKVSIIKNNYCDYYPQFHFAIQDGVFLPVEEENPTERIIGVLSKAFEKFVIDEVSGRELARSPDFAEFREFIKDQTGITVQRLRLLIPDACERAAQKGILVRREEGAKSRKIFYKLRS